MHFQIDTEVAAPPGKTFLLTTDADRFGEWMPGLVRVERLTQGPVGVGSRWRETRKYMGSEATMEFEVTGFESPRSLDIFVDGKKGDSGKGEFRFRYRFEPSGSGGTRIHVTGDVTKMGCMGAVFGFLFGWLFRKLHKKDLAAMKQWIEKQP